MKKWPFLIALMVLVTMALPSCKDDWDGGNSDTKTYVLKMTMLLPQSTRTEYDTDNSGDQDDLDPTTEAQKQIAKNDIFVLQFNSKDSTLFHVIDKLEVVGNQIEGLLKPSQQPTRAVLLTNLRQQGGQFAHATPASLLAQFEGMKEKEIYEQITYSYPNPAEGNWDLDKRKLPMWGSTDEFILQKQNNLVCNLYRSLSKINITVDKQCTNFTLKEVYAYYSNDEGYMAAPNQKPDKNIHIQYTKPDIPATAKRFGKDSPILFRLTEEEIKENRFMDKLYIPESNNTDLTEEDNPVRIVVGGNLNGSDKIQYYRIDMADDKTTPGIKEPFDNIRNHSYIFNIIAINEEGKDKPYDALPNLVVSVKKEKDMYMRGVPDQYTLTTDKSVILFNSSKDIEPKDLEIWTDWGEGWRIEKGPKDAWYTISQSSGPTDQKLKIKIKPISENKGITREGSFYVIAGNIHKEIRVIFPEPETANCYVVGEGMNELIVTIKGNGKDGIFAEGGVSLIPGNPSPTREEIIDFLTIKPAKIGVIWETHPGLIQLQDPATKQLVANTPGNMTYVTWPEDSTVAKYNVAVNMTGAEIGHFPGGNALIGAFDNDNKILWSWHIWVVPEMIDPKTKTIKDKFIEKWTVNDYDVMDRNIGALSNRPYETGDTSSNSIGSMGLLYQWGRKDPFIGANYSNPHKIIGKGLLPVVHYYKDWGVIDADFSDKTIKETIENPTQLIKYPTSNPDLAKGLSDIKGYGEYLWGVADGLNPKVKNLGIKTIYDPSPIGFRVPPVDAFVFKYLSDKEDAYNKGEYIETIELKKDQEKRYGFPVISTFYSFFEGKDKARLHRGGVVIGVGGDSFGPVQYKIYKAIPTNVIISSENQNWRSNLVYVPHYIDNPEKETDQNNKDHYIYQFGDKHIPTSQFNYAQYLYDGPYIADADYYGFYIDFKNIVKEPKLALETKEGHYKDKKGVTHYEKTVPYFYKLKKVIDLQTGKQPCSWFPITAVYDPNGAGVDLRQIRIQKGWSVSVNSFVWTNSTTTKISGRRVPAAMFLHGTERPGDGIEASSKSGRHIHWLHDTNVTSEPQYAGSVRCIRDRVKTIWDINSLTKTATISKGTGAKTTIVMVSVNSDWKLVKPGAPWLKVSPDSGKADKGAGTEITLTLLDPNIPAGTKTSLEFRIANGAQNRVVEITVVE